jgi:hypothetical protein
MSWKNGRVAGGNNTRQDIKPIVDSGNWLSILQHDTAPLNHPFHLLSSTSAGTAHLHYG